jgi:hypothetical protein
MSYLATFDPSRLLERRSIDPVLILTVAIETRGPRSRCRTFKIRHTAVGGFKRSFPIVFRPSRSCHIPVSISNRFQGNTLGLSKSLCQRRNTYSVSLLDLLKRIWLVDPGLKLSCGKKVERLISLFLRLFSGRDVSHQRWSSDLDTFRCGTTVRRVNKACLPLSRGTISTYCKASRGTGPLALPSQTIMPFRLTASRLPSQVSLPTESYTTSTPRPPVIVLTTSAHFPSASIR